MTNESSPKRTPWELLCLAVVVVWGATERWTLIGHGPTSDEISLLKWRGWEWIFRDTVNRWHPPLYRMSFTSWLEPAEALSSARHVSLLAGLLTIVMVWALARGLTKSRILALAAALGMAALPHHMLFSVMFRPYAVMLMLMCAHLLCLSRWIQPDPPRWAPWAVGLTATVLPQIHYLALPWLALTAVGTTALLRPSWRTLIPYLGAPLVLLPLFEHITGNMGSTTPTSPDWGTLTEHLFGMGLRSKSTLPGAQEFWPIGIVATAATTARWRWLSAPGRVTVIGTLSMLAAITWAAGEHRFTPSTKLLIAPMLWAMIAALPQVIPGRWTMTRSVRWLVAVVLGWVTADALQHRLNYHSNNASPSDQIVNFIRAAPERFPTDHAIRFRVSSHLEIARYMMGRGVFRATELDDGCPTNRCMNIDGRLWLVDPGDDYTGASVLVLKRAKTPPQLPPHCTHAEQEKDLPRFAICSAKPEPSE